MRFVEWLKGLIGPRHTVESVALELARGLEDGSITLDHLPEEAEEQPTAEPTVNGHHAASSESPNGASSPSVPEHPTIPGTDGP